MATFRVGQRVRVTHDIIAEMAQFAGAEAVVIGVGEFPSVDGGTAPYRLNLRMDGYWIICDGDVLEPIIDDGRTVVDWASCVWQPPVMA